MGSGTVAAAAPGDRCTRRAREEAVALLSGGGGARRRQQLPFLPQLQLQQLGKLVARKIRTLTNPREVSGEASKAWAGRRGGGGGSWEAALRFLVLEEPIKTAQAR